MKSKNVLAMIAVMVILAQVAGAVMVTNGATTLFYDDFESNTTISTAAAADTSGDYDPDNAIVGTWVTDTGDGDIVQVTDYNIPGTFEGNNYLRITNTGKFAYAVFPSNQTSGTLHCEVMVNAKEAMANNPCTVGYQNSSGGWGPFVVLRDGKVQSDSGGSYVDTGLTYATNIWHKLEVDWEIGSSTCDITFDGETVTGMPTRGNAGSMDRVRFTGDPGNEGRYDAVFEPETTVVGLQNATADFSQTLYGGWDVSETIDGISNIVDNGWAVAPQEDTPHTAVWETVSDASSKIWIFTLVQNFEKPGIVIDTTLRKIRLSYTTSNRNAFADGLGTGGDVTANWIQLTPTSATALNASATINGDNTVDWTNGPGGTDTYTVVVNTELTGVTGFRLETLLGSTPIGERVGYGSGPGNGNFTLSEFTINGASEIILIPNPSDGSGHIKSDTVLRWSDYFASYNVYFGEDFNDVNDATVESDVCFGNQTAATFDPNIFDSGTYYWRIDSVDDASVVTRGQVWSFTVGGPEATEPDPADNANRISSQPELSWLGGIGSDSSNVYIGTDFDDVNDAIVGISLTADFDYSEFIDFDDLTLLLEQWLTDPNGLRPSADIVGDNNFVDIADFASLAGQWNLSSVYRGNTVDTFFTPNTTLKPGTYYWRVDEVNESGVVKGDVWKFDVGQRWDVIEDWSDTENIGTNAWSYRSTTPAREVGSVLQYFMGLESGNWWVPGPAPQGWCTYPYESEKSVYILVNTTDTTQYVLYGGEPTAIIEPNTCVLRTAQHGMTTEVVPQVSWLCPKTGLYNITYEFAHDRIDENSYPSIPERLVDGSYWYLDKVSPFGVLTNLDSGFLPPFTPYGEGSGVRTLSNVSLEAGDRINWNNDPLEAAYRDWNEITATITAAYP